jgi:hypothetical protein
LIDEERSETKRVIEPHIPTFSPPGVEKEKEACLKFFAMLF